jgi:hypothetical protein
MTWRHLHKTLDRRFAQVRAAILQRRDQLVAQLEMELLEHQRRRVRQLNAGLKNITDEANRRVVALLDGYSDIACGGKWQGKRLAVFEKPYLGNPPAIVEQRHARVAEIDALTRWALAKLAKLYDELLPYPDKAEAFEKEPLTAIVDRLMEPPLPIRQETYSATLLTPHPLDRKDLGLRKKRPVEPTIRRRNRPRKG